MLNGYISAFEYSVEIAWLNNWLVEACDRSSPGQGSQQGGKCRHDSIDVRSYGGECCSDKLCHSAMYDAKSLHLCLTVN